MILIFLNGDELRTEDSDTAFAEYVFSEKADVSGKDCTRGG
jgi:hypothetical protein